MKSVLIKTIQTHLRCLAGRKRNVPGVFRAAGLMVPEPSIMSLPMPFIEVVTGCDVEYITANYSPPRKVPRLSHRPCWCAKAPVAGSWWTTALVVHRGMLWLKVTDGGAIRRMQLSRDTGCRQARRQLMPGRELFLSRKA